MAAPSKESKVLDDLFKTFAANFPSDGNAFLERAVYDQVHTAATECPGVTYEDVSVPKGNVPCIWICPDDASPKHAMLYLHGGGFSFGSPNGHRKIAAHLAKACGVVALSVDYRLAPQNPFPSPLDDCVSAYAYLLDQGFPASNIVLAGDSCGGGLVTSIPLAALERQLPTPAASISLSPLYEVAGTGGTIDSNESVDLINTKPFLTMLANRYTQSNDELKKNPLVSPLFSSDEQIAKMPPHWISIAGCDMLRDQGERMAKRLQGQGVEAVARVVEGQQHVFEFGAGFTPEAKESIKLIGEWAKKKLGL